MSEKTSIVKGIVKSDVKLDGKTILITGCNTGIGYITALDMLKRGAKVIMACRSMSKMEDAKTKLLEEVKDGQVVLLTLDLASLDSVRECARKVIETEERLDILINNAGLMLRPPGKTKEGLDMQFGVNHVGHFLFTNLLLDLLKKSAPSRIIILASSTHTFGGIMWDDINMERHTFNSMKAYSQSKSANILHCLELSKRLEGTGVTCYCLHPGQIKTNLWESVGDISHIPFTSRMFVRIWFTSLRVRGKDPVQGAQNTIYCAVAPELASVSGKYYDEFAETRPAQHCRNPADAERLWKITAEMIENAGKKEGEEKSDEAQQVEKKDEAQQEEKKDEAQQEEKKYESQQEEKKDEAQQEEKKDEALQEEKKDEAQQEEKKDEAQQEEKKDEAQQEQKKDEATTDVQEVNDEVSTSEKDGDNEDQSKEETSEIDS